MLENKSILKMHLLMSCQERKVRFSRHSQESSGAGINEVGDAGVSCIQFQVL